jgi:hypothetical protein
MKVPVIWLALPVLVALCLTAALLRQRSWIPDWGEAEPLYPTVKEYGRHLAEIRETREVTASDLESLIMESEFEAIRPYGIVFSDDPEVFASVRVNGHFSLAIQSNGRPKWIYQLKPNKLLK